MAKRRTAKSIHTNAESSLSMIFFVLPLFFYNHGNHQKRIVLERRIKKEDLSFFFCLFVLLLFLLFLFSKGYHNSTPRALAALITANIAMAKTTNARTTLRPTAAECAGTEGPTPIVVLLA